ncbi:MAG: AMP-binding protein, partial [Alphaproteobacteria bacterium]|nr:AMP-binding protein [Alphaproteobacteria bacterium]
WLKTGDFARMEADGSLYIVGRLKELIIRSGFNVYPAEVEGVITSHPDISMAVVVGRSRDGNEEVVAFVQPIPGRTVTEEALAGFVAERLAPYKRPEQYLIRDTLPATPTGKILRHKLQQEALTL